MQCATSTYIVSEKCIRRWKCDFLSSTTLSPQISVIDGDSYIGDSAQGGGIHFRELLKSDEVGGRGGPDGMAGGIKTICGLLLN